MKSKTEWREGCVVRAQTIATDVRLIEMAVEGALPPFEPGMHTTIQVKIGDVVGIRSYTCLPAPPGRLRMAVKRHANSRGGSSFMWSLIEGAKVRVTVPENRFALSWRAPFYLLMAGGIGVTPIYGMAHALAARGASVRMVYGGQSAAHMPFAEELKALLGERLKLVAANADERIDIDKEIASLPPAAELYVCGPLGMLKAAEDAWKRSGRAVSRLRYEVFGDSGRFVEQRFRVHVTGRALDVTVEQDETMLDALMRSGVDMIYDCKRGECGLCAVDLIDVEGDIDHRDVFFSDEEKAENRRMCACVSRLAGGRAVIDIGYRT